MTDLTTDRPTERHEPDVAPGLPDVYQQPDDPRSAVSGGVELTRLIGLARLTCAQALEIGAGVLAEATSRPEPDGGSPGGDRVPIDQVVIGVDGRVVLRATADGRFTGRPPAAAPARSAVEAGLADLADAARLGARPADPADEQLLAELDRAVIELPVAGIPAVARRLHDAADAVDRGAVRAQLAALVKALGGEAGPSSGTGPAGAPAAAVRATPRMRALDGQPRTAWRRIGAWLLSVLVLAAVVLLEVALLRDDIATDIDLLLDAGRGESSTSAAPEPDGRPVVPVAPAAAGSVTAVDLRLLARCAPGAPCTVRLEVRLVPGADPQAVTWSYRIVDRCTGATESSPGGSVAVPAGGVRAVAVGTVPLPAERPVAVVAVTDLPAAAASSPVFVGSCASDRRVG
ncbi:MAG: hypothetical protein ABWY29_02310 [Blastococcus sp.]